VRSWSDWFRDTVDNNKRARKRPAGFIATPDGELPLNTPEGRKALRDYVEMARK